MSGLWQFLIFFVCFYIENLEGTLFNSVCINRFHVTGLFLNPLKTSENLCMLKVLAVEKLKRFELKHFEKKGVGCIYRSIFLPEIGWNVKCLVFDWTYTTLLEYNNFTLYTLHSLCRCTPTLKVELVQVQLLRWSSL